MPNDNPNTDNLKPFKKGESGNPNGRPRNIETVIKEHFLNEHNLKLSKSQAQDIIKNILGKTRSELMDLARNEELPFWIALIANKANRDFKKGSIHILDVLFDRVYGKPTEEVHQTVTEQPIFKGITLDVPTDHGSNQDSST